MKPTTKGAFIALTLLSLLTLGGCTFGTIDSGDVGVRREFNGSIESTTLDTGFYFYGTGDVKEYTARQVDISFTGQTTLKPKAKDNLSLQEFDADVYYTTKGDRIPYLVVKYTDEDTEIGGVYAAAYQWVEQQANSASQSVVSQYDSLDVNKNRDKVAMQIQQELQTRLDLENPGVFHVDNVVIKNVVTDPSIEASIQRNVTAQKELETARIQQSINEQNAKNNAAITQSISPQILASKSLDVLASCAQHSGCYMFVNMDSSGKLQMQLPPGGH